MTNTPAKSFKIAMLSTDNIIATCENCKTEFPNASTPTQANDCVCHSRNGFVYGHYGSEFDISCFEWRGAIPLPNMDPLCDRCIRAWIAEGKLRYRREYLDFDPFIKDVHLPLTPLEAYSKDE